MRTIKYQLSLLEEYFRHNKIATMADLKAVLNSNVNMTIFRKLNQLSYYSSYSDQGKYYALAKHIKFDAQGLWSFRGVLFSKYGTLRSSVKAFVEKSKAGYSVTELSELLHVAVKKPLLTLYRNHQLYRDKISASYIYFSNNQQVRQQQSMIRNRQSTALGIKPDDSKRDLLAHELKAGIILFFSTLDEKQRRLYAGLESLKLGYGGDKRVASLLEIDVHTVSKGRQQLLSNEFPKDGVRKKAVVNLL
jgi:hypothetical protein